MPQTRLQFCRNSRNVLLYIRAIQGHIGVNLKALELMGHVANPYKRKEFLFIEDVLMMSQQSSNQDSSLVDEKTNKERKQTIFFTPLNPVGDNPDEEEPDDDFSRPEKYTFTASGKLVKMPSTVLNAIIVFSSVRQIASAK